MVERVMKTAVDRVDGLIPRMTFTRETAALVCVKPKVHVDVIKRTFRKLII